MKTVPALYAAGVSRRDKRFQKILRKFTKDFNSEARWSGSERELQFVTDFFRFLILLRGRVRVTQTGAVALPVGQHGRSKWTEPDKLLNNRLARWAPSFTR